MLGGIGHTELIIALVIILILFGPKNLPKLARAVGQAFTEFKSGIRGVQDEIDLEDKEEPVDTPAQLERRGEGAAHEATAATEEKKV